MKKGGFEVKAEETGPAEIYELSKTFNEMVMQIKKLIHDIKVKEAQKLDAEINALQSQINPHF